MELAGSPWGIAIAANGDLFVVDQTCCGGKGGIIGVNSGGVNSFDGPQTIVLSGNCIDGPQSIGVMPNGDLLVSTISSGARIV